MAAKRGPKKPYKRRLAAKVVIPKGLDADERAEFNRLASALRSRGTLDRSDVRLIESAARTAVIIARAHRELGSGPFTLETPNGTKFPHPMLGVLRVQAMLLRGLLNDLGLTPKTSKLGEGSGEAESEDSLEEFLGIAG